MKKVNEWAAPSGPRRSQTTMSYRAFVVSRVYVPVVIGIILLAALFGGLGVTLVYLGAKGDTHIMLFGQSMETANVGVASLFIGAVMVILIIRRLLKGAEAMQKGPEEKV